MNTTREKLLNIYNLLLKHFGKQHWWPAETPFEVVVGAILTQSTSWKNVESTIENLKAEGILTPAGIRRVKTKQLSKLIKPALYHNVKAKKLKIFVDFLYKNYDGNLENFLKIKKNKLREELLSIWGIGPETADSIILYAANKPSFVVDTYTKRVFKRLGLVKKEKSYDESREFFESNLPKSVKLYNEYHALTVELGKNYCKNNPKCDGCPVKNLCSYR